LRNGTIIELLVLFICGTGIKISENKIENKINIRANWQITTS
jgi:hypothetical protein